LYLFRGGFQYGPVALSDLQSRSSVVLQVV
jgi:hypothetical protein